MRKQYSFFLTCVVATTTFFACNQSDEFTPDAADVQIVQEDELIERNILNLSSVDASKLARRFANNEYSGESRSASTITVKDVQTITSEAGVPLMYIVNYTDNKGFTVISATKNYTPILAYSDEGSLNMNDASFTDNIFMDEYKTHIESVVNEQNDSLRLRYAIDWSFYEKSLAMMKSRAYSDAEIQQKLAEARTYYGNQGYEVHSLGAATSLITAAGGQTAEERANGFINDICGHTPSQYDCMDVTLLLVKRTSEQFGPFVTTVWHQHDPYCADAPYGKAGCATVAVMQLMYYYQWPAYDWCNISSEWTVLNEQERFFANDVRNKLNPGYYSDKTTFSMGCVETAMETNDSYDVSALNYSHSVAEAYMRDGKPLIVYGANADGSSLCHYWICNGYKSNRVQYAAYMINGDFGEYEFFSGMTDILSEYFNLNLGTGENAWFYQDTVTYNGGSYTKDRIIYIATPNRN